MAKQTKSIRVLVADDHPVMRDGLCAAISGEDDMAVAGEASDGEQAIALFTQLRPDVTLMDLHMPNVDGLQAVTAIRKLDSKAAIVVFTVHPGDARVAQALTLGATSYLLKTAHGQEIVSAIRAAAEGRQVIAREISEDMAAYQDSEGLTVRELTILRLVKAGMSNRDIATSLFLSEATIKAHLKSSFAKLGAADRTQAAFIAIRRGFIDP